VEDLTGICSGLVSLHCWRFVLQQSLFLLRGVVTAVVIPMSLSISFAFNRREEALLRISQFRSFTYQIYLAHSIWEWKGGTGCASADADWVKHTDKVLSSSSESEMKCVAS
jgi:hypothetical protein